MFYITVEDLIAKFGIDWATQEDFDLYADQVNAWLYGNSIPLEPATVLDSEIIKRAAYFLARAAKENQLYQNTDNIKSKKVSAQPGTSTETQYVAYKNVENRWVKQAKDLLKDFFVVCYVYQIDKIN